VLFQHVLHEVRGQDRSGGQFLEAFIVVELEDGGAAAADDPDLGGDGFIVGVDQAEPQGLRRGGGADEAGGEERKRLRLLPTRRQNLIVRRDRAVDSFL